MLIDLYLTPTPLNRATFEKRVVVVVDVLRATTSICAMLHAGARGIIPVAEPGEAAELRTKLGADNTVLAGEREGVKIEGFDFGNSPDEFTPETVGGKHVVMTTTNGTAVFGKAARGASIITGSLVNISRVAEGVAAEGRDLLIACAGLEGGFSIEDTLCGGMLIHQLKQRGDREPILNDAASLALLLYENNKQTIRAAIEQGEHGRFLRNIGFGSDVALAANVDAIPVLPILNEGRLVSADAVSAADQ
jgi:2-phosphosulfolactate phosphatase